MPTNIHGVELSVSGGQGRIDELWGMHPAVVVDGPAWGKLDLRFGPDALPDGAIPHSFETVLSRDLRVSSDRLYYRRARMEILAAQVSTDHLLVRGVSRPRPDRALRSLVLPRGAIAFEEALAALREALWLPWMWMQRRRKGVVTLHGAAASGLGGGVLIVGLNGAGKSTLLAEFVRGGAKVLADNFIPLTQDGRVLPFPELRRDDAPPPTAEVKFRAYGKSYFVEPAVVADGAVPLRAVILLERRPTTVVTPLEAEEAARRIGVMQELVPELLEGSPWSVFGGNDPWDRAAATFGSLPGALRAPLAKATCLSLSWNRADPIPSEIRALIGPPRA